MAQLSKDRHILCTAADGSIINDDDGNIAIWDMKSKAMFFVPAEIQILQFFNLPFKDHVLFEEQKENVNNFKETEEENSKLLPMTTQNNSETSTVSQKNSSVEGTASWKDDNTVKMLIYLWKEHKLKFKSPKIRNDTIWKEISAKLWQANSNWHYSAIQCENKWKDIRKTYIKVKDHNNASGNNPKKCKFYDELDDIFGDKPCVTPVSVSSNLRKRPLSISSNLNCIDTESDTTCENEDSDNNVKKSRKKLRRQGDFDVWSTDLKADAKQREEARERRHQEMLKQSDKAIDAMKEVMLKLIEKI